jgi:trimeric autotransporter adhesin
MPTLTPVEGDPFAPPQAVAGQPPQAAAAPAQPQLVPVEGDPFAAPAAVEGIAQPTPSTWDAWKNFGSGIALGAGAKVMAAGEATKKALPDWAKNLIFDPGVPEEDYETALARIRGAQSQWQAQNPKLALATEAAGAAVPLTATTIALGGAGLGPMAANTIAGGAMGAASGAAQADQNKLGAALLSGGAGAGLGAGATLAGGVAGAAAQKIADAIYSARYGVPSAAADAALAAVGGDATTAAAKAAAMGPGATLADTGPAARDMTVRLAANYPNDASPIIAENLTNRAAVIAPRMGTAVDAAAGPDINAVTQLQALKDTTAANAKAAYDPIMNSGATVNGAPLRDFVANIRAPAVIQGAAEGPTNLALKKAVDLLGGDVDNVPIALAHSAQDQIDDMASSALRSGNNSQARALWQARAQLLDQMPPEYNAARAQYASDKAIENAFTNGRNIFAPRVEGQVFDPDLLESRLAQMSGPEKDAYGMGVRKALADTMGQARSDAAGVRARLANDNGYAVGKLQQVIGPDQTQALQTELEYQAAMQETTNKALQGSKTAMAQATDAMIPGAAPAAARAAGAHGLSGPLFQAYAGSELGGELGEAAGHLLGSPQAGKVTGQALGAGLGATKAAVSSWQGARQAASDATARESLARLLTGAPQDAARALAARGNYVAPPLTDAAKRIGEALVLQGAVTGRPGLGQLGLRVPPRFLPPSAGASPPNLITNE